MPLDRIFMNGLYPQLFTDEEAATLRERADANGNGSDPLGVVRRAAAAGGGLRAPPGDRATREQLERLRAGVRPGSGRAAVPLSPAARHGRGRGPGRRDRGATARMNVRDLLEDQEDLHLRRLGRRRQDDHLGGDRDGHGGAGAEGRGAHDRPGQAAGELARPAGAGQRGAARRPGALRRARHRDEGRAVGDDARREAHLRRSRRAPRARRGDARPHPPEPHLPGDLQRDGGLAGVHGDGEALRAAPGGALRPAGARHAADAARARLHRRARAHVALHRGPLAPVLPEARTAWRKGARALRRRAVLGAEAHHGHRPAAGPVRVLPELRQHGGGLQRARAAREGAARRTATRRSCS